MLLPLLCSQSYPEWYQIRGGSVDIKHGRLEQSVQRVCKAVTLPVRLLSAFSAYQAFPTTVVMDKLEIKPFASPPALQWMSRCGFQGAAKGCFNTRPCKKTEPVTFSLQDCNWIHCVILLTVGQTHRRGNASRTNNGSDLLSSLCIRLFLMKWLQITHCFVKKETSVEVIEQISEVLKSFLWCSNKTLLPSKL